MLFGHHNYTGTPSAATQFELLSQPNSTQFELELLCTHLLIDGTTIVLQLVKLISNYFTSFPDGCVVGGRPDCCIK